MPLQMADLSPQHIVSRVAFLTPVRLSESSVWEVVEHSRQWEMGWDDTEVEDEWLPVLLDSTQNVDE